LIDTEFEFLTLYSSSINNPINKGHARLQGTEMNLLTVTIPTPCLTHAFKFCIIVANRYCCEPDSQHNNFYLERSASAGNTTSNYTKVVGLEIDPKDLISNNAHDFLEFPTIPESPYLIALVSGSS